MQETWVWALGWEALLEEEMAMHSSIIAWIILWTEEPGRLQSMGWQSFRNDWVTARAHTHTHTHMVCAFFFSQYEICLCTSLDQWEEKEQMIPDLWPRELRLKESESNWSPNLGQCKFKCPSKCCANTAHATLRGGTMIMAISQTETQVTHASQTPPVK